MTPAVPPVSPSHEAISNAGVDLEAAEGKRRRAGYDAATPLAGYPTDPEPPPEALRLTVSR
ncbi:MAG: hypothetical protein R3C19_21265 [Planctomycetaceae bacterium]